MGLLRNLGLLGKRVARRPLTREELYSYAAPVIKKPPSAPGCEDLFDRTLRYDGKLITVAEYYRNQLMMPALDSIAAGATWEQQRAACIGAILEESHWGSWNYCVRNAKTEMGRAIILTKLDKVFPGGTKEEQSQRIFIFYMVNLSAQAALTTIGTACYGIDKAKEAELDLYVHYQREIMMTDVRVMDCIEQNHMDEPDLAYRIAEWQEDQLGQVTQQMFNLLVRTKDQIAHNNFNIDRFKDASDRLEHDGQELVNKLGDLL
jgi:hypothetical protein